METAAIITAIAGAIATVLIPWLKHRQSVSQQSLQDAIRYNREIHRLNQEQIKNLLAENDRLRERLKEKSTDESPDR